MNNKPYHFTRLLTVVLLLIPFLLPTVAEPTRAAEATSGHFVSQTSQSAQEQADYVPGELLVGMREDLHQAQADVIDGTLAQLNVQSSTEIHTCAPEEQTAGETAAQAASGSNVRLVVRQVVRKLTVPQGSEAAILAELGRLDGVTFASPNWTVRAAAPAPVTVAPLQEDAAESPDDPLYDEQWYLQNIHAAEAWSVAFGDESASASLDTIRVAIIDSGINFDHPDFDSRILPGRNYVSPSSTAEDDYGHGTHVAGLMGALINNATGVAGVASKVVIDPFKALDQFGEGSISDVVEAICDATDAGADIINLSLAAPESSLLQDAVEYADQEGVLLIAAAGNLGSSQVQWPADYPEVIAVAATTIGNTRAPYSNQGDSVEIAAPGGDTITAMLSTWRQRNGVERDDLLCPSYGNESDTPETYCYNLGTSMAAALVSGAAALVWSINSSLTPEEVRLTLRNTAMSLDEPATMVGQGLLDVEKAVRAVAVSNLLVAEPEELTFVEGAEPYTTTITISNPALEPLAWSASIMPTSWLSTTTPLSGTVRYNEPALLGFRITLGALDAGTYGTPITLTGTRPDKTQSSEIVNLNFTVIENIDAPSATLSVIGGSSAPVLQPGAQPYTETFTLENSSPVPLEWQALLPDVDWITPTTPLTGTVTINAAEHFSVTVDPSQLNAGRYGAALTIVGTQEDDSLLVQSASINFTLASGTSEPPPSFSARVDQSEFELSPISMPVTPTFTLENTGTETVTWRAELPPLAWITATGAITGTLPPTQSMEFTAQVDAGPLAEETHEIAFTFIATGISSTVTTQVIPIQLTVQAANTQLHLPLIRRTIGD